MLVDQGSSADVMFWFTFNKLQLSLDQLRPYAGCLYGFARDQVEVRVHFKLRTTFTDGVASRTESIRYLVVNAVSAYNILLGRPTLNRLRAVESTRHMKMKLPDLSGKVITIKSDQQEAKRGVFKVTEHPPSREGDARAGVSRAESAREGRPKPVGDIVERQIGGRTFKLGKSLDQAEQDQIAGMIARPRFPVSLPHHGPQGQACSLEKKEVQRGEAVGHQGRNKEVVECRPHKGNSIP